MLRKKLLQLRIKLPPKNRCIFLALAAALVVVALFSFEKPAAFFPSNVLPSISKVTESASEKQPGSGLPIRIKIPRIDVDAPIEYVGVTVSGAMASPKKLANVAWYKPGPRPGEIGASVLAGHIKGSGWRSAVFDNLHQVQKGDSIIIENDKSETVSFTVREIKSYDRDAATTEVFNAHDNKAHLNLITCEGEWDPKTKNYPRRLVVFAEKDG